MKTDTTLTKQQLLDKITELQSKLRKAVGQSLRFDLGNQILRMERQLRKMK